MNGRAEPARRATRRAGALGIAALALAGARAATQAPLEEAVTVREVGVLVAPPVEQARWRGARRPGGIQVLEDARRAG